MSISLPPDIKALMTRSISWEPSGDLDGFGQWTYGPAVELTCWQEPHLVSRESGAVAHRKPDGTVVEPILDIYFDGDNPLVRRIKLWDRFTPTGIGTEGVALQALHIETMYGPPFDNRNPWIVVVLL